MDDYDIEEVCTTPYACPPSIAQVRACFPGSGSGRSGAGPIVQGPNPSPSPTLTLSLILPRRARSTLSYGCEAARSKRTPSQSKRPQRHGHS